MGTNFKTKTHRLISKEVNFCNIIVMLNFSDEYDGILETVMLIVVICRFKSDDERTPVNHIVEETFPNLLNIYNRLVQIANPSVEVADLIKLICKIFWSSIYVSPPPLVLAYSLGC